MNAAAPAVQPQLLASKVTKTVKSTRPAVMPQDFSLVRQSFWTTCEQTCACIDSWRASLYRAVTTLFARRAGARSISPKTSLRETSKSSSGIRSPLCSLISEGTYVLKMCGRSLVGITLERFQHRAP